MSADRNVFGEAFGALPEHLLDEIMKVFPQSEERQTLAQDLMLYDHRPSSEELEKLAAKVGRSPRTVHMVIERLVEKELFPAEIGSVPLYTALSTYATLMRETTL